MATRRCRRLKTQLSLHVRSKFGDGRGGVPSCRATQAGPRAQLSYRNHLRCSGRRACILDRPVDGEAPAAATGSRICCGVVNYLQPVGTSIAYYSRCPAYIRCRHPCTARALDGRAHRVRPQAHAAESSLMNTQERLAQPGSDIAHHSACTARQRRAASCALVLPVRVPVRVPQAQGIHTCECHRELELFDHRHHLRVDLVVVPGLAPGSPRARRSQHCERGDHPAEADAQLQTHQVDQGRRQME
jgi:hypothetical protein